MLAALAFGMLTLAAASALNSTANGSVAPISRVATVREFLRTALVARDTDGACEFLTAAERARVGGTRGCDDAIARLARRLRPPFELVDLHANDVLVLSRGDPLVLHLEPLTGSTRPEEVAPASGWRVASGVEGFAG